MEILRLISVDLIESWLTNKWAMPIELYLLIMFNVFFYHFSTPNR
ncbi:hypothetical protein [Enterococcus hirae]|nr:hypothetical protein [Enterococcus hirae]